MVGRADPWGRLPGTARKLQTECLDYVPISTHDVQALLEELIRAGRIALYCEDGVWVCQILDWERNQPPEVLLDCLTHQSEFPPATSDSEFARSSNLSLFGGDQATVRTDDCVEALAERLARGADTTREHRRRMVVALHDRGLTLRAIGRLLSLHHRTVSELLEEEHALAAVAAVAAVESGERGVKEVVLKTPPPFSSSRASVTRSGSESRPSVEPPEEPAASGAGPGESPGMSRLQDELWRELDDGLGPALTRSARRERGAAVRELADAG